MSNSDTHVCTRGTHIRIRLKQYTFTCGTRINVLSWKTNMCFLESTHTCANVERTYVFTYDTLMRSRGTHMCVHLEHNETRVQFRHTCVYTWNTHTYTTETVYIHLRHTHKCVELENKHVLLGKHTHTCANVERTYVFTYDTLMRSRGTHMCVHLEHNETRVQFRHTCVYTWNTHAFTWNTKTRN